MVYVLLDLSFTIFHAALVVFNLAGWAWRKTRRLHLLTSGLTLLSWFGLGLVYGWGYCPCTDWHWRVKRRLGERNLPDSYVEYHVDLIPGLDPPPQLVDTAVVIAGVTAFLVSCWLNWKDRGVGLPPSSAK